MDCVISDRLDCTEAKCSDRPIGAGRIRELTALPHLSWVSSSSLQLFAAAVDLIFKLNNQLNKRFQMVFKIDSNYYLYFCYYYFFYDLYSCYSYFLGCCDCCSHL